MLLGPDPKIITGPRVIKVKGEKIIMEVVTKKVIHLMIKSLPSDAGFVGHMTT